VVREANMNELTAKRLRQLAHKIVLAQGGKPSEDWNHYDQERNCPGYVPAYSDGYKHDFSEKLDKDGYNMAALANMCHPRATDPDGNELMAYVMKPGTLHHKNKVKILYIGLKKLWRLTGGKHTIFGQRFRKTVLRYATNV
jgi:hypothetical protein